MVRMNPGLPARAVLGERVAITGEATAKGRVPDVVPPGVRTVIETFAGEARFAAGTVAVSCVPLTNVVASAVPFHSTASPASRFAPFTVNVNPALPAGTPEGSRDRAVGPNKKTAVFERPPAKLKTFTL